MSPYLLGTQDSSSGQANRDHKASQPSLGDPTGAGGETSCANTAAAAAIEEGRQDTAQQRQRKSKFATQSLRPASLSGSSLEQEQW